MMKSTVGYSIHGAGIVLEDKKVREMKLGLSIRKKPSTSDPGSMIHSSPELRVYFSL
jgi:hypothetical protein